MALRSKLIEEMPNDVVRQATAAGVDRATAQGILRDRRAATGLSGRGKKAWDTFQERLGHLAAAEKDFKGIACSVLWCDEHNVSSRDIACRSRHAAAVAIP